MNIGYFKFFFLLFLLGSCADYRFQKQDNPFAQYSIKSLSVPLFYNESNFSNISSAFTTEIYQMLAGFKGLKLTKANSQADATLIGIVSSREGLRESKTSSDNRASKTVMGSNFAPGRNDFFVPTRNNLTVSLRIIVIKHPTEEEIKFLRSGIGREKFISSKIIFSEVIPLSGSFTREFYANKGRDVIQTQNRGAQKQTIKTMARSAAGSFRDMILYAF